VEEVTDPLIADPDTSLPAEDPLARVLGALEKTPGEGVEGEAQDLLKGNNIEEQASLSATDEPLSSFPTAASGCSSSIDDPLKADVPVGAPDLLRRGEVALRTSNWAFAELSFGAALGSEPCSVAAWAGRGRARLQKGDLQEAMKDLQEALRLDPNHIGAISDLSEARLRVFLWPMDGPALYERGMSKMENNDWNGAVIDFGLAVRLGHPCAQEQLNIAKGKAPCGPLSAAF